MGGSMARIRRFPLATIRLDEKTLADLRVPDNCIQAYYWDTELSGKHA
jgi:hypothetical protein